MSKITFKLLAATSLIALTACGGSTITETTSFTTAGGATTGPVATAGTTTVSNGNISTGGTVTTPSTPTTSGATTITSADYVKTNSINAPGVGGGAATTGDLDEFVTLFVELNNASPAELSSPDSQIEGEASFTGYAAGSLGKGGALLGNMNVDVNFDANTVATSADGFTLYQNDLNDAAPLGSFNGRLTGTGTINNNFVFTSNLDGTLVGGTLIVSADWDVEGALGVYENNLFGVGTIEGTLTGTNVRDTIEAGFLVTE